MTLRSPLSALARITALGFVLVFSLGLSVRLGVTHVSLAQAYQDPSGVDRAVVSARAARAVLGALAGGALAAVGLSFQALLRNPLGDPYALGISGGGALAATVAVLFGAGAWLVPVAAFGGAIGAMALVLLAARAIGGGRSGAQGMLLAGLVFNACAGALLAFLRSVADPSKAQETLSLLLGSIGEETWRTVGLVAVLVTVSILFLGLLAKPMNLLATGEDTAASLGLDVSRAETLVFLASSLAVAGVVSVCGLIPFVGLIVPHYARAWVGADHRVALPASILGGASLLVLSDLAARETWLLAHTEPPVGALTALVGGPFFVVLLRRMQSTRE